MWMIYPKIMFAYAWRLPVILITLTRDIQCESLLRMRQAVVTFTMYPDTDLQKLHLLFQGNRNSATPDKKKKTLKNHPLDVAEKYVETYSSSNAAAQDPEEMILLISIQQLHYKINSLIQKLQKKNERTRQLTDLEWPKSPAQSLHIPSTSHHNLRTSQSCRQNNNFRLIYSNVRNYSFLTHGSFVPRRFVTRLRRFVATFDQFLPKKFVLYFKARFRDEKSASACILFTSFCG